MKLGVDVGDFSEVVFFIKGSLDSVQRPCLRQGVRFGRRTGHIPLDVLYGVISSAAVHTVCTNIFWGRPDQSGISSLEPHASSTTLPNQIIALYSWAGLDGDVRELHDAH
jgi:hypothetical protein